MLSDININGTNYKIGGNIADGQWVNKAVTVFSGVTFPYPNTIYTYTVNNYLPDNDHVYEVMVSCYATTNPTSGNKCNWWVHDENLNFNQVMGYCITRTNSNVTSGNAGILPIKQTNGILTLQVNVTAVGSGTGTNGLYLAGYRRLGKGSNPTVYNTLTINPTPSDATVTFDKGTTVGKTTTVRNGTSVTYTVSKSGYSTQINTTTVSSNKTINVTLASSQYSENQVVFEKSTAGTYDLNLLETGKYEVYCIGGGGGSASYSTIVSQKPVIHKAGGGSGGGFIGIISIVKNSYSIIIGSGGSYSTSQSAGGTGGSSSIGSFVICSGGIGGSPNQLIGGGAGGTVTLNTIPISTTLNSSGNSGSFASGANTAVGGASLYNGYGKGGNSGYSGVAGYVKIVYKSG